MDILADRPSTPGEILDAAQARSYTWGAAWQQSPERTAAALARFVALLSMARNPDKPTRPFLHIETHLWIRPLSRVVRSIGVNPAFGWYGEAAPDAESTVSGVQREALPAVYCRHCGRSGWAVYSPEKDPHLLKPDPARIYRASVSENGWSALLSRRPIKKWLPAPTASQARFRFSCSSLRVTGSARLTPPGTGK